MNTFNFACILLVQGADFFFLTKSVMFSIHKHRHAFVLIPRAFTIVQLIFQFICDATAHTRNLICRACLGHWSRSIELERFRTRHVPRVITATEKKNNNKWTFLPSTVSSGERRNLWHRSNDRDFNCKSHHHLDFSLVARSKIWVWPFFSYPHHQQNIYASIM